MNAGNTERDDYQFPVDSSTSTRRGRSPPKRSFGYLPFPGVWSWQSCSVTRWVGTKKINSRFRYINRIWWADWDKRFAIRFNIIKTSLQSSPFNLTDYKQLEEKSSSRVIRLHSKSHISHTIPCNNNLQHEQSKFYTFEVFAWPFQWFHI